MKINSNVENAARECAKIFDKYKLSVKEAWLVIGFLAAAADDVTFEFIKEWFKEHKKNAGQ